MVAEVMSWAFHLFHTKGQVAINRANNAADDIPNSYISILLFDIKEREPIKA